MCLCVCECYIYLNCMYSLLVTTKSTTHLLNRLCDGCTFMRSYTEEMFVLVSVQGLIRFPMCCLVLAMCEGAAAAALVVRKSSLMCQNPTGVLPDTSHLTQSRTLRHPPLPPGSHPPQLIFKLFFSSSWQE